jgi:hypothetical protein
MKNICKETAISRYAIIISITLHIVLLNTNTIISFIAYAASIIPILLLYYAGIPAMSMCETCGFDGQLAPTTIGIGITIIFWLLIHYALGVYIGRSLCRPNNSLNRDAR